MELCDLVNLHFDFLKKYGYSTAEEDDESCVSCIGTNNRIDVVYSKYTCEVYCQFSDIVTARCFSLQDALAFCGIDDLKGMYQLADNRSLEKGITYLANVIERVYAAEDISSRQSFDKVYGSTIQRRNAALNEYYVKEELRAADKHWERKEYTEASGLYRKNMEFLSPSQRKRLDMISGSGF